MTGGFCINIQIANSGNMKGVVITYSIGIEKRILDVISVPTLLESMINDHSKISETVYWVSRVDHLHRSLSGYPSWKH